MRFDTQTLRMPRLRQAGISALVGRSVPVGYVLGVDGGRPTGLTLKEGET